MLTKYYGVVVLTSGLFLAACPEQMVIWLEEGSSADSLTFGIANELNGSRSPQYGVFQVDECERLTVSVDSAMWRISLVDFDVSPPTRITYGITPDGYRDDTPPSPLVEGCYWAGAGPARRYFKIDQDGEVIDLGKYIPDAE